MKTLLLAFAVCLLVSCAAGPVYVAKNENEGIRTSYQDPKLDNLAAKNRSGLKAIYERFQQANIDVYPNGIGFTELSDKTGRKHYYLLVDVRPRDITFGMGQTRAQERFAEVYHRHFETNLRYVKEQDLGMEGVEGLAFGVHWPVRDLSQCDSHGGFLEYIMIYLPKGDFVRLVRGEASFSEVAKRNEVVTSLDMKKADSVKIVE
ncbi:MAG TPA: hypothetical protein VLW86_06860 [Syntrophorhabdales bacterium]|nr:hypothetical protein [Syntrophorhabdales bacterium]